MLKNLPVTFFIFDEKSSTTSHPENWIHHAQTPHEYVHDKIRKFVERGKDLDSTTVSDLVKYGSSKGPRILADQIWGLLVMFFALKRPSDAFLYAIDLNLFSWEHERRNLLARLSDSTKILRPILNYPEFCPGNIRIITSDLNDFVWLDTMIKFEKRSRYPLYFDTEGLYSKRSFGCKIAALTFYDVQFREVLIVRIHRFNYQNYELMKTQIRVLGDKRGFVIFGSEPYLEEIVEPARLYNCQRDNDKGQMISLQNMCKSIGIHIGKGQTMSNWARTHLRHDQLQYAAMDAVALLYLHLHQIRRNDLDRGRLPYKKGNSEDNWRKFWNLHKCLM